MGDVIFYNFMMHVFDCKQEDIQAYLPSYLTELCKSRVINKVNIVDALNKYISSYFEQVADVG